jgi:hypothetical protein
MPPRGVEHLLGGVEDVGQRGVDEAGQAFGALGADRSTRGRPGRRRCRPGPRAVLRHADEAIDGGALGVGERLRRLVPQRVEVAGGAGRAGVVIAVAVERVDDLGEDARADAVDGAQLGAGLAGHGADGGEAAGLEGAADAGGDAQALEGLGAVDQLGHDGRLAVDRRRGGDDAAGAELRLEPEDVADGLVAEVRTGRGSALRSGRPARRRW